MTVTKNGVIAVIGLAISAVGIILARVWGIAAAQISALGAAGLTFGIAAESFISATTSVTIWKRWVSGALIAAGFIVAGYSTLISATVGVKIIGYVVAIVAAVAGIIVGKVTIS